MSGTGPRGSGSDHLLSGSGMTHQQLLLVRQGLLLQAKPVHAILVALCVLGGKH